MIATITTFLRDLGLLSTAAIIASRAARRARFRVPLPSDPRTVELRFGTTDYLVYRKVILTGDYDFEPRKKPTAIVDAGANVGLSAIHFALKFPAATIVAIEPERANFELLLDNVRTFPNVRPVHAALWCEQTRISIVDPGIGSWGFRVEPSRTGAEVVPTVTIEGLLRDFGFDHIDILKLDIEGAEREVLAAAGIWMPRVGTLIAELHDRYRPGASRAFFRATEGFDWEWVKGENMFVTRAELLPSPSPQDAVRVARVTAGT